MAEFSLAIEHVWSGYEATAIQSGSRNALHGELVRGGWSPRSRKIVAY